MKCNYVLRLPKSEFGTSIYIHYTFSFEETFFSIKEATLLRAIVRRRQPTTTMPTTMKHLFCKSSYIPNRYKPCGYRYIQHTNTHKTLYRKVFKEPTKTHIESHGLYIKLSKRLWHGTCLVLFKGINTQQNNNNKQTNDNKSDNENKLPTT